jgi:spore germination protein YaaH
MARLETYKNNRVQLKWIIGGMIAAILLIASAVYFIFYPFASKEKKIYFHGENPILYQGKQNGNAIYEGKTLFVPLSFLQKNIDSNIQYDEKSKSVIITTKDKVVQMPTDSLTYFVNEKPIKLQLSPILNKDGAIYVAIDPVAAYYPINYKKMPGSEAIWIQTNGENYTKARITSDDVNREKLRLRTKPTWQSSYTADINPKEAVMIEGEKNEFYYVRNAAGMSGYIKKKYVNKGQSVTVKITRQTKSFTMPKLNGSVQLTWEAVYTKNPNPANIAQMPGINVVSPTWFSLGSKDGSVNNIGSLDYSKWAHSKGYQVWALFSNSFNPTLTHDALKDFETRKSIIRALLNYSQLYHLQGINFDIENVNPEDGPLVTQFMREAAVFLHQAGLVVSMDITFTAGDNNNWSSFYERKKLAQIADYLMVMAYDEHWGADSGSGSVASLPWVEKNLTKLLNEVPHNKLVLGVPLYTRLWKEQLNTDGTTKITAAAMSMDKAKQWIAAKGLKPVYDENSGQNYAEYYDKTEKATYKLWIEDELSLAKRANLAQTYKLAGVGTWSRYYADQTAWTALNLTESIVKK